MYAFHFSWKSLLNLWSANYMTNQTGLERAQPPGSRIIRVSVVEAAAKRRSLRSEH